ncbi:MAG TPA: hypothetical protein PKE47_06960 [Verrucomicrobiota bacterium]|nr:hypothetical protein [Verrucomicrobiota bacterium]
MLVFLRLVLGAALFYAFTLVQQNAVSGRASADLVNAGLLALCVALGLLNAIVWAPFLGRLLADPLTGTFTEGAYVDTRNPVIALARKLHHRGWRRAACFFAFLEGLRNPDLPGAFVVGLKAARPGSWLERVFAREVWRFDNAENCLRAWKILTARGLDPGLHRRPEVNLLIHSVRREKLPDPALLALPAAPPPAPPARNPRIRLFPGADPVPPPAGEAPAVAPPPSATEEAPPPAVVPAPLAWRDRLRVLLTGRVGP